MQQTSKWNRGVRIRYISGILRAVGERGGEKKVSASLTGFYVCISSMTGYTCPKALAGILFVVGLLEVHQRNYVLWISIKMLSWNINCHRFCALSKTLNFLSFLKSDSSYFYHSSSLSPTGQSLCLVRLLRIYKTGLIVKALESRNHSQFYKYSSKHERPPIKLI